MALKLEASQLFQFVMSAPCKQAVLDEARLTTKPETVLDLLQGVALDTLYGSYPSFTDFKPLQYTSD